MGTMQILGPPKDETVEWDARDTESVRSAYRVYARLKRAGYLFFSTETERRLSRFNKRYRSVVAVPPAELARGEIMVAFRPDDDFEPTRALPRSLGSLRLSADVEVYAIGICASSVCSPIAMEVVELLEIVNREYPTGISSSWTLSDDEKFASGQPNPTTCERDSTRVHRLLEC